MVDQDIPVNSCSDSFPMNRAFDYRNSGYTSHWIYSILALMDDR